jgi:hypothetical protein
LVGTAAPLAILKYPVNRNFLETLRKRRKPNGELPPQDVADTVNMIPSGIGD